MFRLAIRSVRHRWASYLATFTAIFFCALMMIAAGGMGESGLRLDVQPQRLAGAPIVLAGNPSASVPGNPVASLQERVQIDSRLADEVRAVPGVADAIPDVSFPASVVHGTQVGDEDTPSFGHGWASSRLMPYRLAQGAPPSGRGQVVLDELTSQQAGAGIGQNVRLSVHGTTQTFRVSGIADPGKRVTHGSIFFSEPDVARFAGTAKTDMIGVLPTAGTDVQQLRDRIGGAVQGSDVSVLTGNARGPAEFPFTSEVTDLMLIAVMVFGLSLITGLLGVASTLSLTFQQRHREMAVLRAIGGTPKQLRRMVLGETVSIAVLATALAILPGMAVGNWLFDRVVDLDIAPDELAFHRGWIPTALAATFAVLTAIGAAVIAGRRATRTRPVDALASAEGGRGRFHWLRLAIAFGCFAFGIVASVVAMTMVTGPLIGIPANWSAILFAVGLAVLGPEVAKLMVAVLAPLLRAVSGMSGYLASLNAKARAARMAAVITPIMVLTALGTAALYVSSTESSVRGVYTESLRNNLMVQSGPDGLSPDVLRDVRGLHGVAGASEFVTSTGFVEKPADPWLSRDLGGWQLKGFTAAGANQVGAAHVVAGNLNRLTGDSVALNAEHAAALKRGIGDRITMRMGDGERVNVRIVALYTEKASFESIVLPARLLAEHTTVGQPRYLLVAPQPGADRTALSAALGRTVAAHPGSAIADRDALTEAFNHNLNAIAMVNYLFVGLLMGFTTITVVNSLALAIAQRRREFGLQRIAGSTKVQVLRMMGAETLLAGIIGVVLGTAAAILTLVAFSEARTGSLVPSGPVWIYLFVVGMAIIPAVVVTLASTWRTMRSRPIEAAEPA